MTSRVLGLIVLAVTYPLRASTQVTGGPRTARLTFIHTPERRAT